MGLLLPDLARVHIPRIHVHTSVSNDAQEQIKLGCLAHYEADRRFHQSAFFEDHYSICLNEIKLTPFSKTFQRSWFVAHIIWEMLLDRMLLQQLPNLGIAYYNTLLKIDDESWKSFLIQVSAKDCDGFFKKFEHFRKAAYLKNYTNNELFLFSVKRVIAYVAKITLDEKDSYLLLDCILRCETKLSKEMPYLRMHILHLMSD